MLCAKKTSEVGARICDIRNRKVYHDYFVGETFECGLVLLGSEVKSLRSGHAQIGDAFVRPNVRGELLLYNANIAGYKFYTQDDYNCTRPRKLLLHKREIRKILLAIEHDKMSVIPTRMYFKHGLVKIEIAICKGKKLFDKREGIKKQEALREAQRIMADKLRNNR